MDERPDDIADVIPDGIAEDFTAQIEEMTEPVATPAELRAQRLELVAVRYRLDDHTKVDLEELVAAHGAVVDDGALPDGRGLRGLRHGLGHAEVVASACEVILGDDPGRPVVEALHTLAIALLMDASGPAAAGARVLLARCSEHEADHRGMEAHIEAALEADPQYWPALLDAAWFAEDRGDAARAISLLTETRVPAFEGEIERLRRFTRSGDLKVGRNDPCPCGSGKKYKACCLNKGGFSLAERSSWLMDKAQGFLARSPQYGTVEALAFAAAGDFARHQPDAYRIALDEYPMVVEVALFEAGLLRAFLDQRGYLLPEDEKELAESWLARPLRLWTLIDADPAAAVLEGAGERVEIDRPGALGYATPGDRVLARPLAIEGLGHRILTATVVPPEVVDALESALGATPVVPERVAHLIGVAEQIPPETIDGGDPLVLCSISFAFPDDLDAQELADRLDAELLDIDESGEWIEPEDAPDIEDDPSWAPNGSVTLYDEVILVRAGSVERAERLVATVERLVPEAEVTSDIRRPRAELIEQLLAD